MPAKRSSRAFDRPGFSHTLAWAALLSVAAGIRAFAWSRTVVMFNDGPIFLALAEAISQGHWRETIAHPYHPLYPFSIAQVARTGLSLESSAIIVSIFGGLLAIVALYFILERLFDREVAWLGAVALALHPWAVDFSSDVMSDGLYLGFYLAGFAALQEALHRSRYAASIGCAVATALAYGVRPEGLGLLCVGFALFFVKATASDSLRATRRSMLLNAMLLVVTTCLLIGPYVAELTTSQGALTLTQKKSLAGLAIGDARSTVQPVSAAPPEGFALWLPQSSTVADDDGVRRATNDGQRFLESVSLVLRTSLAAIRYEVVAFALIGFWALRRDSDRRLRNYSIGLPIIFYSLLLILLVWGAGYLSRRHALAAWVPILGLAVVGWRTLITHWLDRDWTPASGRSREGRGQLRARWAGRNAVALSLIVMLALVWGPRDLRARRGDRESLRDAAEWIAAQHPNSGPVAALKLRTAYYAESPFVPLSAGTERPIESHLRAAGAQWVVIDADRLADHHGLEEGSESWLEIVHTAQSGANRAWVLRVRPPAAD